ncbi:MAG: radical SAM protein [Acidobacteria bacterium]|nr:radical SAM protein [Acidobacteriota bacterium]
MNALELQNIAAIQLERVKAVYGPVRSWRVGMSLGIDLLCVNSICSFNCSYCQLGFIQVQINQRHCFVPTAKVLDDLEQSDWESADIITFSGSGEPTLASNLGEVIARVKERTGKPVLVLTNGTLLGEPDVQEELLLADRVYLKLDAGTETTFRRINRPVPGVTLQGIVEAGARFRKVYGGILAAQIMLTRSNLHEVAEIASLLKRIKPDEVQLNTPTRPYPREWVPETRGSHDGVSYAARPLKTISQEEAAQAESQLRQDTGLRIVSVYGR